MGFYESSSNCFTLSPLEGSDQLTATSSSPLLASLTQTTSLLPSSINGTLSSSFKQRDSLLALQALTTLPLPSVSASAEIMPQGSLALLSTSIEDISDMSNSTSTSIEQFDVTLETADKVGAVNNPKRQPPLQEKILLTSSQAVLFPEEENKQEQVRLDDQGRLTIDYHSTSLSEELGSSEDASSSRLLCSNRQKYSFGYSGDFITELDDCKASPKSKRMSTQFSQWTHREDKHQETRKRKRSFFPTHFTDEDDNRQQTEDITSHCHPQHRRREPQDSKRLPKAWHELKEGEGMCRKRMKKTGLTNGDLNTYSSKRPRAPSDSKMSTELKRTCYSFQVTRIPSSNPREEQKSEGCNSPSLGYVQASVRSRTYALAPAFESFERLSSSSGTQGTTEEASPELQPTVLLTRDIDEKGSHNNNNTEGINLLRKVSEAEREQQPFQVSNGSIEELCELGTSGSLGYALEEAFQDPTFLRLIDLSLAKAYDPYENKIHLNPIWYLDDGENQVETTGIPMNGVKPTHHQHPHHHQQQVYNVGSTPTATSFRIKGKKRGSRQFEIYWNPSLGQLLSSAKQFGLYANEEVMSENQSGIRRLAMILSKLKHEVAYEKWRKGRVDDNCVHRNICLLNLNPNDVQPNKIRNQKSSDTKKSRNEDFTEQIMTSSAGSFEERPTTNSSIDSIVRTGLDISRDKNHTQGNNENSSTSDTQAPSKRCNLSFQETSLGDQFSYDQSCQDSPTQRKYVRTSKENDNEVQHVGHFEIENIYEILEVKEIAELLIAMERTDPYKSIYMKKSTRKEKEVEEKFKVLAWALALRRNGYKARFEAQFERTNRENQFEEHDALYPSSKSSNEQNTLEQPISSLTLYIEPEKLKLLRSRDNQGTRIVSARRNLLTETLQNFGASYLASLETSTVADSPRSTMTRKSSVSSPPSPVSLSLNPKDPSLLSGGLYESYSGCPTWFHRKRFNSDDVDSNDDLEILSTLLREPEKSNPESPNKGNNNQKCEKGNTRRKKKDGDKMLYDSTKALPSSIRLSSGPSSAVYNRRAGRPKVNRIGCKCLLCKTYQTPQWRFMTLFDEDEWMDLVCNACYMKFNGSRPHYSRPGKNPPPLPELHNIEKPMRPTLEDYKLKGPCAYPHLMRRNGSKQYGVIGKRSLTTPKMATVDLVSESSQLASQQTQSSCASSELIGSSVTHDHNSDDTVVGSSKGNAISSAKPAQKEESISMKLIGQGRSPHRISVTRSAWDQTKIEERKQPVPSSSLSSPTLSVPSLPLRSPTLLTDTQSSPITYLTNVHPYQNDSPMQQWLTSSTACYHHPSSALMPFYDLGSMPYGIHPYMSINNAIFNYRPVGSQSHITPQPVSSSLSFTHTPYQSTSFIPTYQPIPVPSLPSTTQTVEHHNFSVSASPASSLEMTTSTTAISNNHSPSLAQSPPTPILPPFPREVQLSSSSFTNAEGFPSLPPLPITNPFASSTTTSYQEKVVTQKLDCFSSRPIVVGYEEGVTDSASAVQVGAPVELDRLGLSSL